MVFYEQNDLCAPNKERGEVLFDEWKRIELVTVIWISKAFSELQNNVNKDIKIDKSLIFTMFTCIFYSWVVS